MRSECYLMGIAAAVFLNFGCDKNDSLGEREGDADVVHDQSALERNNRPDDEAREDSQLGKKDAGATETSDKERTRAKVEIQAAPGNNIGGEARFTEKDDGVEIVVDVTGAPVGEKGIHIHENGDCSDIPAKSMGGHFSPDGKKHGLPSPLKSDIHLGDLGNIDVKDDGTGKKEITVKKANLREGDPMSLLGKALVIHQDEDKGASHQPSGDSGDPIACGVIQKEGP